MHAVHNTIASASILRMLLTREGVPAFAKESTVEMLIVSVPMIILGGVLIGRSFYKKQSEKTENAS